MCTPLKPTLYFHPNSDDPEKVSPSRRLANVNIRIFQFLKENSRPRSMKQGRVKLTIKFEEQKNVVSFTRV